MWLYKVVCVFIFASATANGFVYQGCYQDDRIARILPHKLADANTITTHQRSVHAVAYSWECFCGNTLNATAVPELECHLPCPGDKRKKCGGDFRISIYSNLGSETILTTAHLDGSSTTHFTTKDPLTHASTDRTTAVGVGIGFGLAVGLLCASGAVVAIIVLRREKVLPCLNTSSTSNIGTQTFGNGPEQSYEDLIDRDDSNPNYSVLAINIDSTDDMARYYNI